MQERDPEFNFLSDPHEYYLRKPRLWSPSGVFLKVKYVDPTYYTEESRYRGSYVHRVTHLIDDGDPGIWKKIHHDFLGFIEAYCEFKEIWRFKPRLREIPIYCPGLVPIRIGNSTVMVSHPYGFTPDGEGLILDGDEAIVEIKTGTMPWWACIQTAAQDMGIHAFDKDPRKTRRRICVELKKTGKFRVKEYTDDDDYHTWLSNLKTCQRHHVEPPKKLTSILSY